MKQTKLATLLVAIFAISACGDTFATTDDSEIQENEEQGYLSKAWLTISADACKNRDEAIIINNGEAISDLSNEKLTCTVADNNTNLVYSISWTGDDFDRDGSNDTLSFDLRVEAFDGSAYSYSETEGESSVTELGSEATLYSAVDDNDTTDDSDDSGYWDIEDDNSYDGIAVGQSLRFSIENITVSAIDYSAEFDGFTDMSVIETKGGRDHLHIRGFGEDLDSGEFDASTAVFSFDATDELVITSAGDYYSHLIWSVSDILTSFTISNPNLVTYFDDADYSVHKVGPNMVDVYPQEETERQAHFPVFSWDTIPRWLAVRNANTYSDAQIESIANNNQLVMLEKANKAGLDYVEEGIKTTASRLKAVNADIKTIFYWNSWIHYTGYTSDEEYDENVADWSDYNDDGSLYIHNDLYYTYNHDVEALREWWIKLPLEVAEDDNIDGVFVDKMGFGNFDTIFDDAGNPAYNYIDMINNLWEGLPEGKLLMGNALRNEFSNGNRSIMEIMDGSYLERWNFVLRDFDSPAQNTADATAVSIQLMREAAAQGKFITLQTDATTFTDEEMPDDYDGRLTFMEEHIDMPLAIYLIVAEENVFFSYQDGVNAADSSKVWDSSVLDVFSHPLGEPLTDPVRNGYVYTRSFEYVDVWLDLKNEKAVLTWYDESQSITSDDE